ncbi:CAP domain-containing protein [Thermoleophilia bacterium SCSIO 60948]|nr:CAP domain-containing protein [Thermoleophilia bacterium SCSIO 60948]
MTLPARSTIRGVLLAGLAAACVALLLLGVEGSDSPARAGEETAAAKCAGANKPVRRLGSQKAERALACRVRAERTARERSPGEIDALLEAAADAHARRMLERDCFSHRCPGEADLEGRLRKAGYLDGASDWEFAENIGCATTADAMVRAWLRDRSSRRNLLGPEFEDIGIGFTKRAPSGCEGPRKAGAFTLVLVIAKR